MSNESKSMDDFFNRLSAERELQAQGLKEIRALEKTALEYQIDQWPEEWGDDLWIIIYGDFAQPKSVIEIESLGITVHPKKLENTAASGALCALKAVVKVGEKSVPALIDAAHRINVFLGSFTLISWGNSGSGWYSSLTRGSAGIELTNFEDMKFDQTIQEILTLDSKVRKKVEAALYWIRAEKNLFLEDYSTDLLRVYSGYWNAFECLVEAVNLSSPRTELTPLEKQNKIDLVLKQERGKITPRVLEDIYRSIINPGFVAKASHALNVCFQEKGINYINECFQVTPKEDRLYDIRNAINHGNLDAENLEELVRIEDKLERLWLIIWHIFSKLITFSYPVNSNVEKGENSTSDGDI